MSGWHTPVAASHTANRLLNASAVRTHCREIFEYVARGESSLFALDVSRIPATAAYVADVIRERFPKLNVPYHSRWRHFEAGGVDRWRAVAQTLSGDVHERARVRIDLVIPSVLLDAGAGAAWRYVDHAHQQTLARSEGLGVASLALFTSGVLSNQANAPLRADAAALRRVRPGHIAKFFQVDELNPLLGLEGRAALISRLGEIAEATPAVFGAPARLGNLYDYLRANAVDNKIEAGFILATLLRALGPMWPQRSMLDGVPLGDCWPHSAARGGWVPFHKLSQWLSYSLLEPLEEAGLTITGLDQLTGLPEYRNGGLLLDCGVIVARDATFHTRALLPSDPAVIEWRALTVALLDQLAEAVRREINMTAATFPLARVLEGGTWAAGRKIAAEKRAGGVPPVTIDSDGTVF